MNCYVFITDENCKDFAQSAIRSLLEQNPKHDVLVYTTVDLGISGIKQIYIKLDEINYDIKDLTVKNLPVLAYRIKLLDELKDKYDKIMMVDTDMIFRSNIDYLFDLSDTKILGRDEIVLHKDSRKRMNNNLWYDTEIYLNSGLLVIPSSLLKEHNLYQEFIHELDIRAEKYICPEQDFINYTFRDSLQDIGYYINCFVTNTVAKNFNKVQVIHYCGQGKPLRIMPVLMQAAKIFFDVFEIYLEKFKEFISEDFYQKHKEVLKNKELPEF